MKNLSQWIEKARSGVQMSTKFPTLSSFSDISDIDGVLVFHKWLVCKNLLDDLDGGELVCTDMNQRNIVI